MLPELPERQDEKARVERRRAEISSEANPRKTGEINVVFVSGPTLYVGIDNEMGQSRRQ